MHSLQPDDLLGRGVGHRGTVAGKGCAQHLVLAASGQEECSESCTALASIVEAPASTLGGSWQQATSWRPSEKASQCVRKTFTSRVGSLAPLGLHFLLS